MAGGFDPAPDGIAFEVAAREGGETVPVRLKVPGLHNVANALAALCAVRACGVGLAEAARLLGEFSGIRRRFDIVGRARDILVIDDFAHNPDKIAATLDTLHALSGAPAADVPAARLRTAPPHEGSLGRKLRRRARAGGCPADARAGLLRRHGGSQHRQPSTSRRGSHGAVAGPSRSPTAPPAATVSWRWPARATAS